MKISHLIFILFTFYNSYSAEKITCTARYSYEVYHEPQPDKIVSSGMLGSRTRYGTGTDGYYEKVWSNTYTLNIVFASGQELNEALNTDVYKNQSIIAIVEWNNGGVSIIEINEWTTHKEITKESFYDQYGNKIQKMTGYDQKGRFWQIYL